MKRYPVNETLKGIRGRQRNARGYGCGCGKAGGSGTMPMLKQRDEIGVLRQRGRQELEQKLPLLPL